MSAGSVAAGGVYFESQLSKIKNKLEERDFGSNVSIRRKPSDCSPVHPKCTKLRRLNWKSRNGYPKHCHQIEENNNCVKEGRYPDDSKEDEEQEEEYEELVEETNRASPLEIEPDKSNTIIEIINVSGTLFLVDLEVCRRYPDTLLGSDRLHDFYIPSREEFFIERHKHVFAAVIRFYTNDEELLCPPCTPKALFENELHFYDLYSYYQEALSPKSQEIKVYKPTTRKEEILLHMEFPGYSRLATGYAIFDLTMIVISTIILVLESIPELSEIKLFEQIAGGIEIYVNVYFTVQAIILIAVYPSKKAYFVSPNNWIDIISILPFYLRLIAKQYLTQIGGFRVLRLIRLLRILKLFRHSQGSRTMMHFLYTSIPEIVLLLLMWSIGVLMFGPLLYFVEKNNFTSAFSGMWFCVVTIGTVGYGDMVPETEFGKILAAFYTILNLTIMTIPISIIITKFNKTMKKTS